MKTKLHMALSQEAVMGDVVTGEDVVLIPRDPEDMLQQVKSDISIGEVHHQVSQAIIDKEELEQAANMLESIHHSAVSIPHDEHTAKSLHLACANVVGDAVENPAEPLGFYNSNPEASMESFLTNVKETLQKIWDAIVNVYKGVAEVISDFFDRLRGATGNLRKWHDKLKKQLDEVDTDSSSAVAAIKVSKPHILAVQDELTGESLMSGSITIATMITNRYSDFIEDFEIGYSSILDWFKSSDGSNIQTLWRMVNRHNEQRDKLYRGAAARGKLPGCRSLGIILGASTKDFPMPTRPDIVKEEKCKEYRGDGTILVMNRRELEDYLEHIESFIDTIEAHDKAVKDIQKLRDNTIKAADDWIKQAEKGVLDGVLSRLDVRYALNVATNHSVKGLVNINKYLYEYSSAALEVVELNIDAFK